MSKHAPHNEGASDVPSWYIKDKINEARFCEAFLRQYPLICIQDSFYTVEGRMTDENWLKQEIYRQIKDYTTTNVTKKVNSIIDLLRVEAYSDPLPLYLDRINMANGTLYLDGRFEPMKYYCTNRLPINYNPNALPPVHWVQFLNQLLYPEDIPTLQEFMGYCLIPSTKGQKMLFLTGKGGEGKSRIGLVMKALLGSNMNVGSISKVETSPFARADLQFQLAIVDDDMKLEALPQTNNIKSIVTAELPMDLEKKGKQSYQGLLYARFMAFGNGTMHALYDKSDGFYRRQLIVSVREKDKNRVDDPYLAEKMCAEIEGIFLWCLEGLLRLLSNGYKFTVSERTAENLTFNIRDSNNIVEFLESTGYIEFHADSEITSRALYAIYVRFCDDNMLTPLASRTFSNFLIQHEKEYGLEYTNTIYNYEGKRVRGFMGICAAT